MATLEMSVGDMATKSSIGMKSTSLWTTGPAVSVMAGKWFVNEYVLLFCFWKLGVALAHKPM